MKYSVVFKGIVASLVLSGCSLDASILNMDKSIKPPALFEKSAGAEFVSGSTAEYQLTPGLHTGAGVGNRYRVMASVGHYLPQQVMKTPNRGYLVFSSVQGNMLSDELASEQVLGTSSFDPN